MPAYTAAEIKLFKKLNSPAKIQDFLNALTHNPHDTWRSPRNVLKAKAAYCIEGAVLAAAILQFHGHKPLLLDLRGQAPDVDHVIAPFKVNGYWGAISKTNYAVLRYREPIYKTIRELVLSYFHEYFLDSGYKTLRDYSLPVSLQQFDKRNWQTSENDLSYIAEYLDDVKHYLILNKTQIKNLRKADSLEIEVGKARQYPEKHKKLKLMS